MMRGVPKGKASFSRGGGVPHLFRERTVLGSGGRLTLYGVRLWRRGMGICALVKVGLTPDGGISKQEAKKILRVSGSLYSIEENRGEGGLDVYPDLTPGFAQVCVAEERKSKLL